MSYELLFRNEAKLDILNAQRWYEIQEEGLGDRFLSELWHSLDRIIENPLAYPIIHNKLRRALLHVFPYALFYEAEGYFVTIFSCFHCSRESRNWG